MTIYRNAHAGPTRRSRTRAGRARSSLIAAALLALPLTASLLSACAVGEPTDDARTQTTITGCAFTTGRASVQFAVVNVGSSAAEVRLRWEFRDAEGGVAATAETLVAVPVGQTVRGSQSTEIPDRVAGGTCNVGS